MNKRLKLLANWLEQEFKDRRIEQVVGNSDFGMVQTELLSKGEILEIISHGWEVVTDSILVEDLVSRIRLSENIVVKDLLLSELLELGYVYISSNDTVYKAEETSL